jgi:hypothetical protein
MNISDLIKHLNAELKAHGDLPILINDGDTIRNLFFVAGDADMGDITQSLANDHINIETC